MNIKRTLFPLLLTAIVALAACKTAPDHTAKENIAPETSTGFEARKAVRAKTHMVAAANPHAARAGDAILKKGGSATDATIAMALVLTLVEPQSSGIGGGSFMVHYSGKARQIDTFDGRETAPAAATEDMFLGEDGKPRGFMDAVVGGLSVGTPGMVRALEAAHKAHGVLPWKDLFEPAITLAEEGFELSPRLHGLLTAFDVLAQSPTAGPYFYKEDGTPKDIGTLMVNKPLAQTLRAIADGGADAFYTGAIAEDIANAAQTAWKNPGGLTAEDMAGYKPVTRPPVCADYRDAYKVCGMAPPTSGGVTGLQIMGVLSHFDLPKLGPKSAQTAHLFAEAARLGYADRGMYLADPDFVDVPSDKLLAPDYLKARAGLISMDKSMGKAEAGEVPGPAALWAPDQSPELPSTTHLVAVDGEGNAVSMTASIENAFGSMVMVRGFLLNNQLTDFSFVAEADGKPIANRVAPGKRPRSSMAPFIVLNADGSLKMAVGSPGGSRIILYSVQAMLGVLDWDLDMQQAIDLPHIINRNGNTELEDHPHSADWVATTKAALEALGHTVDVKDHNSGLHGIAVEGDTLVGGADPRREGLVIGQ